MLYLKNSGTFFKASDQIMRLSPCLSSAGPESLQAAIHKSSRDFVNTSQPVQMVNTSGKIGNNSFEEVKIPVPWGHISGKWWGSRDVTPLLGLHGIEDNAGTFDRIAPLLEVPAFLALDAPGHGESSHFPEGMAYSLFDFVICLRRIVKHYGWKKVSIFGHSFGSATGLLYSALFPDEVHAFASLECARVLMACEGLQGLPRLKNILEKTLKADSLRSVDPPAYTWEVIMDAFCKANRDTISREHAVHLLNRGVKPHPKQQGTFYFSRDPKLRFKTLESPDIDLQLECAKNVKCHVMTIFSSKGLALSNKNPEIPQYYMNQEIIIKESAASFERHNIPGIHHVHLTDPDIVAPIVNKFFNRTGIIE